MKKFATVVNGIVTEVIPEFVDFAFPAAPASEGQALESTTRAVALSERYSRDFVAALIECPPGTLSGHVYEAGTFSPPPPRAAGLPKASEVRAQRDARLAEATLRLNPLQDAVDLGLATPAESALLAKWKKYRVDLSRVEQQPGFPAAVQWPAAPE